MCLTTFAQLDRRSLKWISLNLPSCPNGNKPNSRKMPGSFNSIRFIIFSINFRIYIIMCVIRYFLTTSLSLYPRTLQRHWLRILIHMYRYYICVLWSIRCHEFIVNYQYIGAMSFECTNNKYYCHTFTFAFLAAEGSRVGALALSPAVL